MVPQIAAVVEYLSSDSLITLRFYYLTIITCVLTILLSRLHLSRPIIPTIT